MFQREPLLTPSQIKREPQQTIQTVPSQPPLTSPGPVMVEVKKEVMSSDEMVSPGLRSLDTLDPALTMDSSSNLPLDPQG